MMNYLLQVSLGWSLFLFCYFLMFRKETFFQINRWYLLSTLVIGLTIPLAKYISIDSFFATSPVGEYVYYLNQGFDEFEVTVTSAAEDSLFQLLNLLVFLYMIVTCILVVRFGYGIFRIRTIYKNGKATSFKQFELIQSNIIDTPFSFLNKIFIPTNLNTSDSATQKILTHEECHCAEWHSLDVLMVELLRIIFWFNPLIYIYKKELKGVHEYIADDYVLQFSDKATYGQLLLEKVYPITNKFLENQFYNVQIKNRIMMMTKMKSEKTSLLKYIAILPLMFCMAILFTSCENEEVKVAELDSADKVFKEVDEQPLFPGCEGIDFTDAEELTTCSQQEMLNFVYKNVQYPADARKADLQGTAVVKFIVEKDGSITNEEIVKSVGGGIDEESLRIVKMMPKWLPGKQSGNLARVYFHLPIKFRLE